MMDDLILLHFAIGYPALFMVWVPQQLSGLILLYCSGYIIGIMSLKSVDMFFILLFSLLYSSEKY